MTPRFGVTLRITLVFVAFAAALLAVVGTLSFGSGRDALEGAAVSELLSSALEKEAQIDRLIALQQGRIELIAAAPALAAALAARGAARPAAMARASDELLPHTRLQPSEFIMLAIADPDSGRLLAATSAAAVGAAAVEQPFFLNGKHGYFMQPPHLSRFVNAAAIAVSAPITAADGALLGVLAGWIDLDGLNRIMLQRSGVHYSDEVFLVNQAAQFVTQPRFLKQPGALRLQARSRAVQLCLAGNSGVLFSDDYRGVPSITIYRWLPRHKLGLITKISQAEASLPVRDFGQALLAMGALILLLGSAIAVWLARTITRPLHTLRRAVAHFGHGERDAGLPSAGADELGELAREFKRMAAAVADKEAQLLSNAAELERRVRERTQELQRQADLLDLAHDAIIVLDAGERVAYWNHGAQEMYGWSREQALGRELAALLDAGAAAPAGIAATLRQHGRWEGRLIHARRDGSRAVVASRQARHVDERSQSTVTLIINSDITEHSQAEEELNKFFDLSLDLLCIASVDGHFKRLNPAWEKTLGYSTNPPKLRIFL